MGGETTCEKALGESANKHSEKIRGGGREGETENPVVLEDLMLIKEAAIYLDFEETKTTIIVAGEKPHPKRCWESGRETGCGNEQGEDGDKPDNKIQGEVHPMGGLDDLLSSSGTGDSVSSRKHLSSVNQYREIIKRQSTGREGSLEDTREGGTERTFRPGREKTREDQTNQKDMGILGKTKRTPDNGRSHGRDRVKKRGRLDPPL